MRVFVITLNDACDRQEQSARQLNDAGIDFQFVPAVNGNDAITWPDCQVDERQFVLSTGRKVTPGEVGCFASHRLAWKMCIELGEPVLIMEDDFRLTPDFVFAVEILQDAIDEFGFIRLQTERRAKKSKVRKIGRFTLWRYTKAPNSAMCYGLSPTGAEALARQADVITAPVDIHMKRFWRHGQRMYGITPYSVVDSELCSKTSIAGRVKAQKSLGVRYERTMSRLRHYFSRQWLNLFSADP